MKRCLKILASICACPRLKWLSIVGIFFFSTPFSALAESFVVQKIVVEGNHRVTRETVLTDLNLKKGATLSTEETSALLRKLYQTGLFEKISLKVSGQTLIVQVVENPTIAEVKITGNSVIATDQLNDVLKRYEIAPGRIVRQSVLAHLKQGLLQQYNQLGYYNARVEINEIPLANHRIFLKIEISEGLLARVRHITILGNHVFSEKLLIKQLDFTTHGFFTWITRTDRYSEPLMASSLEKLKSYYMDHGYLQFKIKSAEAQITPNHQAVDVVIVVDEGETFTVSAVSVVVPKAGGAVLQKKLAAIPVAQIHPGDLFSKAKVIQTEKAMMASLGDDGYLFADITVHPTILEAKRTVALQFQVALSKRVYVRHITFSNHTRTNEDVFRREMLQWESAPASMTQLETSKLRLKQLPFVRDVDMSIQPVSRTNDQVDVNYQVKEDNAASATFKVGYSQIERIILGLSFNQKNFLGTGSTFGINLQDSRYQEFGSIEYTDPYYTPEGISRAIRASASRVDPRGAGVNNGYTTHDYGLDVLYGIPVGTDSAVHNRLFAGFGYQNDIVYLIPGGVSQQIDQFVTSHGTHFQVLDLKAGYSRDSKDKAIFPTVGTEQSLFFDVYAPLTHSSVGYYTANYHGKWYQPLYGPFILLTKTDLGYGNGFGGINYYPFFRNFYAGGIDSVRGFQGFTLGPRDSNGKPFGGNMLVDGSLGLIFPNPVSDNVRTSAYVDVGNVYTSLNNRAFGGQSIDSGPVRYSVGMEADILTPFAPIRLSLAKAMNIRRVPSDYLEAFQFAIGANF